MIKILFTSLAGLPKEETGGPNKVINAIANSLPRQNYSVEFISKHGKYYFNRSDDNVLKKEVDTLRELFFNKSKIYRKIFTSSFYLKSFFKNSIDKITQQLNESDFDILNAHDVRTLFSFNTDKKIILSVHSKGSIVNDMISLYGKRKSLQPLFKKFNELEITTLSKVSQIIFPSDAARQLYFQDLNLNPGDYKTRVIYNGVDLKRIELISPDKNFLRSHPFLAGKKLKILNVANHIKVKNIDKILYVLSELKKKTNDFIFINVGSGPLTKFLKSLTSELGLKNNVIFFPILKNEEIIKLMKICDVYISLSERVIFDLVILEALASGMKVIASNEGGNREVIVDQFNGYLVDLSDKDKIVNLILEEKKDLSENIKSTIQKYSIEKMIDEYIKVYEE